MEFQTLEANRRKAIGKGPSRKLRLAGRIPAVVYGHGLEPMMIDLTPKDLTKALQGPHRRNTVLKLTVKDPGKPDAEFTVMMTDHELHPVKRNILHVDFINVDIDKEMDVEVPLTATGKSKGIGLGGVLVQVFHRLPVRCKPANIPICIEHDITEIMIGGNVKAADLRLPPDVKVRLELDQTVLAVAAPTKEEEKVVVAEGEGVEGAEGAEGAEGEAAAEGGAAAKPGAKGEAGAAAKPGAKGEAGAAAAKPGDKAAKPAKAEKGGKGKGDRG